jgi:hypothetical protein
MKLDEIPIPVLIVGTFALVMAVSAILHHHWSGVGVSP